MPDPSPFRSLSPDVSDDTGASGNTGSDREQLDLSFLDPPQGPEELGRLGRYVVRRVLGHGGMGVVFAADDPTLGRAVAVKCMLPEVARKPASRDRFLREARSAAAVRHDNVVPIYDISEAIVSPFIVMPLLDGEPLDKWLAREGRRPVAEVRAVGRQIAAGLAAAHARGLIHRDLKPANVWLEAGTGRALILDFGLARPVDNKNPLTVAGVGCGTLGYMALEQTTGDEVDHRADLFSLGCVLYVMATDELPFGHGPLGRYIQRLGTNPIRVDALNTTIPAELSILIESLEYGRGVGKDMVTAVSWFRKAAEAGSPKGMYNLADMYEFGKGSEEDREKATHWFRKAADGGYELAKTDLERLGVK